MRKQEPSDIQSLIPPNRDYRYFEGWRENRFQAVTELASVNAWWLSEAALLAYADERFIEMTFESTGLAQAGYQTDFVSGPASTHCFLAHGPDFVLVAFRGTEIMDFVASLKNWLTNLRVSLIPDGRGGRVHEGFQLALDGVWDPLRKRIVRVLAQGNPGRRVWLTGHSLGAALATLATSRAMAEGAFPVGGLYTFGSPRVGDAAFARRLHNSAPAVRTFRFVNYADIVTRIPPPLRYRHVGRLCYFTKLGRLQPRQPGWLWQLVRVVRDEVGDLLGPAPLSLKVPKILEDHAPIKYAIRTWNHHDAQRA